MAMNLGTRNGTNETLAEMNTTPLIDVMLVLLVMLIITIPIQTHSISLNMPAGTHFPVPPSVHTLTVDFDGALTWDSRPVPSLAALDRYFPVVAKQSQQDEIHVMPNRLANYGLVARIMSDAQRIGITRIGFAGEEQYLR